jgi:flagellin
MSGIVLSGAVRSNLITLQNTAELQARVQERLSTGKKVNSALDNPTNFFTASGLSRRATNLSALLDGMSQGIKTLEAADNAMKSITKTVETMQANIRQARQDKSFKGVSYTVDATAIGTTTAKNLTFSAGAVGTTPVNVATQTSQGVLTGDTYAPLDFNDGTGFETLEFDIAVNGGTAQAVSIVATDDTHLDISIDGGTATTITIADSDAVTLTELVNGLNTAFDAAGTPVPVTVSSNGGKLVFTGDTDAAHATSAVTVSNITTTDAAVLDTADFGFNSNTVASKVYVAKTVDELVADINADSNLTDKVKASNDGGKLRIENLSTEALTVVGATATAVNGGTGGSNTQTIGGNDVRKGLMQQFNDLRKQLDKLAGDGSYNGINLVKADKLKITFNEFGTSSIEIQAKNVAGTVRGISTESNSLNIAAADADEFSTDSDLDARLDDLNDALTTLQTQSSDFGAALTTVQNRQEFTRAMINTLQQGADSLTLADSNEEGANLLALNTRQQLSQTALSLASQASQAVLRLF